jgi:hypothetical protein
MYTVPDFPQSSVPRHGMHTVSYSEARDNLKKVMDKAAADRAPIAPSGG